MERQQKAYKGVIDYFKKKILDGELRPGEKLPPERDIAERLNVSRNSVREAIRIMDMTGVISSQQLSLIHILDKIQYCLNKKYDTIHMIGGGTVSYTHLTVIKLKQIKKEAALRRLC